MSKSRIRVISLGWGVQSFTLAAMVALGELEPVDVAIHSDTGFESVLTYEFAKRWTPWLESHGVSVATVHGTNGDISEIYNPSLNYNFLKIPAFSIGKTGKVQIGRRQCTIDWKILPQRRWLRANRKGQSIDQLVGISFDERERMRLSDVQYIQSVYPLVEKRITRFNCKQWLEAHDLEIPPKSACVFCPYHSLAQWRQTASVPADWSRAVEVDQFIHNCNPGRPQFLNAKVVPITELDLSTQEENGQMTFFDCSGTCWL